MSSETIALIIKILPTILFGTIVISTTIQSAIRGYRKSLIFFINYIISIVLGLAIFLIVSRNIDKMNLNTLWVNLGGYIGVNMLECETLFDAVEAILNTYIPAFSSLALNVNFQQLTIAIVGVVVNLVLGILFLIVFPLLVRLLLYFIYLIFFREKKYKAKQEKQGKKYKKRAGLGMLVGLTRGLVCAILSVSVLNSIYYIAAGGIYYEKEEPTNIEFLESISTQDYDINEIYYAVKASRSFGVNYAFEMMKINGKPIDYYYADLFVSSSFTTFERKETAVVSLLNQTEEGRRVLASICLREELGVLVGLLEGIIETNAITISEGTVMIDQEILLNQIDDIVDSKVNESNVLSELVPLAIVSLAEEIQKGNIKINDNIDPLFTDEMIEKIKQINIPNDISNIIQVMLKLIEVLPIDPQTNQVDTKVLSDVNFLLSIESDTVKEILNSLSEVSLVVDVIFPVGVGYGLSASETILAEQGISITDIDLSAIDWSNEIVNLGNLYEQFVGLEIDFNKLQDTTVLEGTKMTVQMDYIVSLCDDETFETKVNSLLVSLIDSDLYSQLLYMTFKSLLSSITLTEEQADLQIVFNDLKTNLNSYDLKVFKDDFKTLVNVLLNISTIMPLISQENLDAFEIIENVDVISLRAAIVGIDSEKGLYDVKLLNGDFNGDGNLDENCTNVSNEFVVALLKTYASSIISDDTIDSINDWEQELTYLIDAIEVTQNTPGATKISFTDNPLTSFPPELGYAEIDDLTKAFSKSTLLMNIVENAFEEVMLSQDLIETSFDDIVWRDTFDEDGNVVSRGELNKLLKVCVVASKEDNKFDFNDQTQMINAISNLETEEIDILTDSQIISDTLNSYINTLFDYDFKDVEYSLANKYIDDVLVEKGELQIISDLLKIELLKDSEGNFAISKLTDIDTLAQLIESETSNKDAITIAESKLIMCLISNKVSELSTGDLAIIIPNDLTGDNAWIKWSYGTSNKDYTKGEFYKLIYALYSARQTVITNSISTKLEVSNLIEGIIRSTSHNFITDSKVLYATISDKIIDLTEEENPTLSIREEAKYTDSEIIVKESEITLLLDILSVMGCYSLDNLKTKTVFDKLSDDSILEMMCNSNIINITVVSKLTDTSLFSYPQELLDTHNKVDVNADAWYPTTESDGELRNILKAVSSLGITVDASTDQFSFDINNIINSLSTKENGEYKVDVVYKSRVFAKTISTHILDVPGIVIPEFDSNLNPVILEDNIISQLEVKSLVLGINKLGISFSSDMNTSSLLNISLSKLVEASSELFQSAILHLLASNSLINEGIITATYYKEYYANDTTSNLLVTDYVKTVSTNNFVNKEEIIKAISGFTVLYTADTSLNTAISNALAINLSGLQSLTAEKILAINDSCILSYIFSDIIYSNHLFSIEYLNNIFETKILSTNTTTHAFSQKAVYEMLEKIINLV